jgi:hypothetical protein
MWSLYGQSCGHRQLMLDLLIMSSQPDATVDLSDPADIRRKLPGVRALYESKRSDLASLEREVEHWRQFVRYLSGVAGEPTDVPEGGSSVSGRAPAQDAAVAALARLGEPTGPAKLYRYMLANNMQQYAKSANQVGANLWAAKKAGRITKTPSGLYAPPGWSDDDNGSATLRLSNGAANAADGAQR